MSMFRHGCCAALRARQARVIDVSSLELFALCAATICTAPLTWCEPRAALLRLHVCLCSCRPRVTCRCTDREHLQQLSEPSCRTRVLIPPSACELLFEGQGAGGAHLRPAAAQVVRLEGRPPRVALPAGQRQLARRQQHASCHAPPLSCSSRLLYTHAARNGASTISQRAAIFPSKKARFG